MRRYYPGPDKVTRANRDDWPITRKERGGYGWHVDDGTQLCSKDLRPLLRSQTTHSPNKTTT